jgi:hypothetical protein
LFPWAAADDFRLHRRARATLETSGVESYRPIVTVVSYVEPQSGDNPGDFWGIQYSYEAGGTTRRGSRSFKKKPDSRGRRPAADRLRSRPPRNPRSNDFEKEVAAVQPVIDSIVWE